MQRLQAYEVKTSENTYAYYTDKVEALKKAVEVAFEQMSDNPNDVAKACANAVQFTFISTRELRLSAFARAKAREERVIGIYRVEFDNRVETLGALSVAQAGESYDLTFDTGVSEELGGRFAFEAVDDILKKLVQKDE